MASNDSQMDILETTNLASNDSQMDILETTNLFDDTDYEHKRSRYMYYRTVQIVLCVVGLLGNTGVLVAWTCSRRKKPMMTLMMSLATWDLALLSSFMYYCVRNFCWWYHRTNRNFYPWSGSLYQMGYDLTMYLAIIAFHCSLCTSVFTILAISVVRYIAVVRPLIVRRLCSRKTMIYLILSITTSAIFLSFCFCIKFLCLSFATLEHSVFCQFVTEHRRAFSYPYYVIIGMLPWMGTIPLSVILVLHVLRIARARPIRHGSCMDYGSRRITCYVIAMVSLCTMTYPVCLNLFLAMQESPDWSESSKEDVYLTSDFLFIINSIAHIFLFYAGGTFFSSLIHVRILYFCPCTNFCPSTIPTLSCRHDEELTIMDNRYNVSWTRSRDRPVSRSQANGFEATSL